MGGSSASHLFCGTCARSRFRIQYTVAAQSNRNRSRGPAAYGLGWPLVSRPRSTVSVGGVGLTQYQRVRILYSIDGISRCVLSDGGLASHDARRLSWGPPWVISEAETFTDGSRPRLVCPIGMEGCLGKQCLQHWWKFISAPLARNLAAEAPSTLGFAFVLGARIMERDSRGRTSTQRDSVGLWKPFGFGVEYRARSSSDSSHQRMSKQATVERRRVSRAKRLLGLSFVGPSVAKHPSVKGRARRHFQTLPIHSRGAQDESRFWEESWSLQRLNAQSDRW